MSNLLDANVILRYLLNDIQEQADLAEKAIKEGAYTIPEVIAEVVYVLEGVYEVKRTEIRDVLSDLMNEISVDGNAVVLKALTLYGDYNLDYVDCVLIARSRLYGESILSFDKKLNRHLADN